MQKDYLSEKLQMVERAREDVYFRQLDQQLIAKMREQTAQEESAEATQPLKPPFHPHPGAGGFFRVFDPSPRQGGRYRSPF